MNLRVYIKQILITCFLSCILLLTTFIKLSAEDITWIEVAKSNNEIQFIDPNSINYNNRGLLSVVTKYSEINPENNETINSNSYLMAIDCENRLYNKFPANADLKQLKKWEKPTNNKLIKKTIINSCSY